MTTHLAGSDQETVILAALLHDVGKFAQRAAVPLGDDFRLFDRSIYGEHGAHARHSAQFVAQELAPPFRACSGPILCHHNPGHDPQDKLVRIIAAADRFAAAERLPAAPTGTAVLQPLANLLATLRLDHAALETPGGCFHLNRLDPGNAAAFFPSAKAPDPRDQERAYSKLWAEFLAAHRQLDQSNFTRYLAGLYSVLMQHTWCIPSAAYASVPDISLFDHARTTAAIAGALHAYLEEAARAGRDLDPLALGDEQCFLLVVGDLSGIQEYLYDVANVGVGGVARRLRARSLYLQLITEVAAQQILAAAGMPFLNTLMASGGRFYLLLPNHERGRRAVAEAQRRVDSWLLQHLGGELALNLAAVPFAGQGFESGEQQAGFGSVVRAVNDALAPRKQNRLREALQTAGRWDESAFLRQGFGGAEACAVCGKQPATTEEGVCSFCHIDAMVGRELPRAAYLALYDEERPGAFRVLGHAVQPLARAEQITDKPYLVLALRGYDASQAGRAPLLARPICNYVPVWSEADLAARPPVDGEEAWPGTPVTFADLARRAQGRALLGFLKADVDRLGEVFVFGLKPARDSSSRLAQLSRMLDLFFSGYLPSLLRSRFPDCYSVYAGGDDLLLVGPWDQLIELATALSEDFARLVQNPQLHLSAGIFIAKPQLPIATAARAANEALEMAKDAGRDRLCLLGHTLTWQEWRAVHARWRELAAEAQQVAGAFLYRLLTYARMWRRYAEWQRRNEELSDAAWAQLAEREKERHRTGALALRFQPLLAYDLTRNLDRAKAPGLHALASSLLSLRPGDAQQRLLLDNLDLLAQLWLLGRGGDKGD